MISEPLLYLLPSALITFRSLNQSISFPSVKRCIDLIDWTSFHSAFGPSVISSFIPFNTISFTLNAVNESELLNWSEMTHSLRLAFFKSHSIRLNSCFVTLSFSSFILHSASLCTFMVPSCLLAFIPLPSMLSLRSLLSVNVHTALSQLGLSRTHFIPVSSIRT